MMWSNLLARLERRLEKYRLERIRRAVFDQANAAPSVLCTPNAVVFNHGKPANIILNAHVVLDGTLECYERGRLEIGPHSFFGRSRLFCAEKIVIGAGVMISDNVVIMDSDLHPISGEKRFKDMQEWARGKFPDVYSGIKSGPVIIGDKVWIGANAVILKNVRIGEGAIIGAGSVVNRDVEARTIVAGNPARVVRELLAHEY